MGSTHGVHDCNIPYRRKSEARTLAICILVMLWKVLDEEQRVIVASFDPYNVKS